MTRFAPAVVLACWALVALIPVDGFAPFGLLMLIAALALQLHGLRRRYRGLRRG